MNDYIITMHSSAISEDPMVFFISIYDEIRDDEHQTRDNLIILSFYLQ